MGKDYLLLRDIIPYQLAVELGRYSWGLYEKLGWQDKKVMGDQFITSVDSCGANVAEGYGRYHYLDRIKFYYNARGSAMEAKHWSLLLKERGKISNEEYEFLMSKLNEFHRQINIFIKACYPNK